MLLVVGCNKEQVPSAASTCYPDVNANRSKLVTDVAVTVQASGGLAIGYRLVADNGVGWSACNLPEEFKRDGLAIYVSGYWLTWPGLEHMNLVPIPFEVTRAKLRQL
ncbi:hypothetical protein GCM10028817_36560 [Spirosoma pomorum]